MNLKRTMLSFLATAFICFMTMAQNFVTDGLRYRVLSDIDHTVHLYGPYADKPTGDLVIPEIVSSGNSRYYVYQIGASAFKDCTKLTSVIIPNSVKNIEVGAFINCSNMKYVKLPDSIEVLRGFYNCSSITSLEIPESVVRIDEMACCKMTSLKSVNIPHAVVSIEPNSFSYCTSLTSITIPKSVRKFGWNLYHNPFVGCTSLKEIIVEEGNPIVNSLDGAVYSSVNGEDHRILVSYPCARPGKLDIPDYTTDIAESALESCVGITSIEMTDAVENIGKGAFKGCTGLKSIRMSNSLKTIEESTFSGCSSLTSIVIPNSVTKIGPEAYRDCESAIKIEIPDNIKTIGKYAFSGCRSVKSVSLPCTLTEIGDFAFNGCSSLTSVTIPDGISIINSNAFDSCSSLTSLTLPESVRKLEWESFAGCSNLRNIYVLSKIPPVLMYNCLKGVPSDAIVYVPKGTVQDYYMSWAYFSNFREMGDVNVNLSSSELKFNKIGESMILKVEIEKDDDVTVKSEKWTSSNQKVATVENGVVKSVGNGSANITYSLIDGYGVTHSVACAVVVTDLGIDDVVDDNSSMPTEYFNLNGVRVNNEYIVPGIYIVRKGGKIGKIVVR
ncbi:MAG: leucine-rich repeat protein [Prevotella sp.]|nr:leucine-rich repeat protein [Bacteroides sp.]MCM1365806.1 leucine-rich repeat protein [Prevotella sp.]MCM1436502.1 leucine-rich repeat protein [Prevotella sp.]